MDITDTQYEIHLHGSVPLRHDVGLEVIEKALTPLWRFVGASSFEEGALSFYTDEPGLVLNKKDDILHMCWTVQADEGFDLIVQELCQNLNEIAREGAPIEISYFDLEEDSEIEEVQLIFVGPNTQTIVKAQRDLLIKQVLDLMERHFEASELAKVVAEIDKLFDKKAKDVQLRPLPSKTLWAGIPFTSLCDPTKRRLH